MRENTLNKILVVFCLLALFGCKAKKQIVAAHPVPVPVKHADKLSPIRAKQISFNTFSGKARTSLNIDGSTNDCTLNIRINRDKKIWVSVTAILGIEIARAIITPDSIEVVNRLQSVYLKKPFSYIYTYANRQINYGMLQALLIGNAAPQLLNDSTKYEAANNNITLSGNLHELIYKLVIGPGLKVTQTSLSSQQEEQSLQVNNNEFIQSGTQQVPSHIDIASVAKDKKIQVNLRYVKVDFNQQQDYPFSIPSGYSPED